MKIKVLPSAHADLDRGRKFYARQEKGLGDYFLDSLFSDIDIRARKSRQLSPLILRGTLELIRSTISVACKSQEHTCG